MSKTNNNANFKTKKNIGRSRKLIQVYKSILVFKQTIHISKKSKQKLVKMFSIANK